MTSGLAAVASFCSWFFQRIGRGGEGRIVSFYFCVIKGMRKYSDFKIFLSNPRGGRMYFLCDLV